MFKALIIASALFLAAPAEACPMADAAAYKVAAAEVQEAEGTKLTLKVDGMHCGDCSNKITAALKKVEGVNAAATAERTKSLLLHLIRRTSRARSRSLPSALRARRRSRRR